ncbi:MAG: hypothetical protein UW16_C0036G0006 [Microgenomates group bacterium GW2011_GWC1_44_10]|nr:MAG: hypothetical protein UW16_C0036G0006 [Microgenomates group bacterium GW2011_GWC1_44_10]
MISFSSSILWITSAVIALLGFFSNIDGAMAVGGCPGTETCQGTGSISLILGCEAGDGVCVVPRRQNFEYSCDGDCKYGPFTQWECRGSDYPTCDIRTSSVFLDCCSGGGGSNYDAPKCTDPGYPGGVLTCEGTATNTCVQYKAQCDWVFPSYRTPSCGGDETKFTCQTNCGCCATGEGFSCDGSTYNHTYTVYGWEYNNRGEMVPAQDPLYCATINDVYDSSLPFRYARPNSDCIYDSNDEIVSCVHTSVCKTCGCSPICTDAAPDAPVISTPTNGQQLRVGTLATINWPDIGSWGMDCTNPSNHYEMCIKSNEPGICDYVGDWALGTTSQYSWTPTVSDPSVWIYAGSHNGVPPTVWSSPVTVCVEDVLPTVNAWTAWPATPTYCGDVTRTRTCSETCGTDDCSAYFTSKAGCDVAANCSFVDNRATGGSITQTEIRCNECGPVVVYGACDPDTQTEPIVSCTENCGTDDCAATPPLPCCVATYPDTPTLVFPANGAEITYGTNVTMDWNDIASWGYACPANDNHYNVCVSQVSGSCTLENTPTGLTSYATRPATIKGNIYWSATADNSAFESQSITRNFCVEGFDITNTSYVSAWSSCNSSHQRTRTCTENCGTNNCTGIPLVENCIGTITGTLFDASDLSSCPADIGTNPSYTSLRFSNANFDLNGPWPAISLPVSTDANGNYSESVYASSNGIYSFDYTDLISSGIAAGIKTECGQAAATVTDQGQTVTKNTGFWRNYGGWWQAKGGSVYGDDDLRSEIPSSLPTEMSLILPNPTAGNRRGLLSYGVPRPTNMLGSNPNAKVSTSLWEIESKYAGQIYDWSFYDNRFNLFTTTTWSTGQPVNYTATDTTNGYKILESAGSVTSFNYSPSANQFVIFIINGNVNITSNIIVPNNAFLAIIAHGTITFDPSIAQAGGWYVGTSLAFPCHDIGSNGCDEDDQQFQGKGSFIGWNSVSLGRSNQSLNNTQPSELFTYSLDLFLNAPKPMKYYTKHYKPFIP